jgi:polar amino acid transport system substrate-binding protein
MNSRVTGASQALLSRAAEELTQGRSHLRAAANLGNPYLVHQAPGETGFDGISIFIATDIAKELRLPLEIVRLRSAPETLQALIDGRIDIACLATDRSRTTVVAQTEPFISVLAQWITRIDSGIRDYRDIDRRGRSIVVARGTAYDLFVTRAFSHASIVRTESQHDVFDVLLRGNHDVAAGMPMNFDRQEAGEDGFFRFTGGLDSIDQAVTCRSNCGTAVTFLQTYVRTLKASGSLLELQSRYRLSDTVIPV